MDSPESCLAKIPLFKEFPEEKLSEIARISEHKVVPPRTVIFREGDVGDSFYIINSGKVHITKKVKGAVDITLAELGEGDFFGQLAILSDDLRWVNVETLEETHLTILSKDQFDDILKKYPNASFAFAKQMSKYLARNIQVIKRKSERRFRVSRTSWLDFFLIFFLCLLCGGIFNQSNPNGIHLTPKLKADKAVFLLEPSLAMEKYAKGDALLVDARPHILYEQMHIENAVNIPLSLFDIMYMMRFGEIDKNKDLIVYGRTISKHYDEHVAAKLSLRGHNNVMLLKGGLSDWKEKGYPVTP